MYYLRTNDSRLWWRWFSLESGIIGSQEFVASGASWTGATAMTIVGGQLYHTMTDGRLYRAPIVGASVGGRVVVDSTTRWAGTTALFAAASGANARLGADLPDDTDTTIDTGTDKSRGRGRPTVVPVPAAAPFGRDPQALLDAANPGRFHDQDEDAWTGGAEGTPDPPLEDP
jgi:hypothetical protein